MIRKITIMITKIKSKYTSDVSKENEVFNINKELITNELDIAAIYWEVQSMERTKVWEFILSYIVKLFEETFSSLKLWYIFGTLWVDDNRIVRHKGFVKRIKSEYQIPDSVNFIEKILELKSEKKLKFSAAVPLSELENVLVIKLIKRMMYLSYIVAVPVEYDMNDMICQGWDTALHFDMNLTLKIIHNHGFIIKPLGIFDDLETGYICLGSSKETIILAEKNKHYL